MFAIALLTAVAGLLMLWLGYRITVAQTRFEGLGSTNSEFRTAIRETVKQGSAVAQQASAVAEHASSVAQVASEQAREAEGDPDQLQQKVGQVTEATQAVARSIGPTADYVRALAELTKNLGNVTPAVAAFVVSTILFITAGTIVTFGL